MIIHYRYPWTLAIPGSSSSSSSSALSAFGGWGEEWCPYVCSLSPHHKRKRWNLCSGLAMIAKQIDKITFEIINGLHKIDRRYNTRLFITLNLFDHPRGLKLIPTVEACLKASSHICIKSSRRPPIKFLRTTRYFKLKCLRRVVMSSLHYDCNAFQYAVSLFYKFCHGLQIK